MEIKYSTKFIRNFKKLPLDIKKKAILKEKIFIVDISNSKLKVHKLRGVLHNCFSFSIDYSYRIIFMQEDKNTVVFLDIGNHSIYN